MGAAAACCRLLHCPLRPSTHPPPPRGRATLIPTAWRVTMGSCVSLGMVASQVRRPVRLLALRSCARGAAGGPRSGPLPTHQPSPPAASPPPRPPASPPPAALVLQAAARLEGAAPPQPAAGGCQEGRVRPTLAARQQGCPQAKLLRSLAPRSLFAPRSIVSWLHAYKLRAPACGCRSDLQLSLNENEELANRGGACCGAAQASARATGERENRAGATLLGARGGRVVCCALKIPIIRHTQDAVSAMRSGRGERGRKRGGQAEQSGDSGVRRRAFGPPPHAR